MRSQLLLRASHDRVSLDRVSHDRVSHALSCFCAPAPKVNSQRDRMAGIAVGKALLGPTVVRPTLKRWDVIAT